MRAALIVLLGAVLAIGGVACRASGGKGKEAPKAPEAEKHRPTAAEAQARQTQYARLAIVCAPGPVADAKYTGMILEQAKRNVRWLAFLKTADFPSDATVDASVKPPKVTLADPAAYDAVVCSVFSYGGGRVVMESSMFDLRTGNQIWEQKFDREDPDVQRRLVSFGYWLPSEIKKFYVAPK